MAVARDDLRGDRLDSEAELFRDMGLDAGIDRREGSHGPRYRTGGDFLARRLDSPPGTAELRMVACELETEGGRLRMDAVAAARAQRAGMLAGAPREHLEQAIGILDQQVRGLSQLNGKGGIEHVRGGHALMHPAGLFADMLGDIGEKGDDVVPCLALDLVDPRDIEAAALAQRVSGAFRDGAGRLHRFGGKDLDLEHDPEAVLRLPDGGHAGACVAGDHNQAR